MPSRVGNSAPSRLALPRFELPALDLGFGRITDGTNIPPPPASPVLKVPTPPQTPPAEKEDPLDVKQDGEKSPASKQQDEPEGRDKRPRASNGAVHNLATPPNGNAAVLKRSVDEDSTSPVGSGRESSLRRIFGKNMLSYQDAEARSMSVGTASLKANASRPESRGTTIVADDRRRKRSSAWFRRLRGGDSRRSTLYFDESTQVTVVPIKSPDLSPKVSEEPHPIPVTPPVPVGPPPPKIPELVHLQKDGGILGSDLFKNIK
ncbi:hypothetical protein GQ602_003488 [Ophiocordyceps camponoti-floridani]|uniref:Uncharacterized protein n=1 Tax=Ophiocordyceps camponoti-floridani TaxID=2030778 RepID=A0A8H4Q8P4_9HYPO|nr:hypothetical protein GQ602_003488 [Ophiocordyceps camponoti-floridani]